LPLDVATFLSAKAWAFIAPKTFRHGRALRNLELAFPEKTPEERERIARDMWANLGRVMAETFLLDRILDDPSRMEIENPELLARYRGKMGAAICASLHMGNWELAMWPLTQAGAKPAAVYRLVENPLVDLYLRSKRKKLYPGGLFARGSAGGLKAGHDTARMIGAYVRSGGRLGFLADLYDWKGAEVAFFGRTTRASVVPAMMARRVGARLWAGRCVRVGSQSRFKILIREMKVPRSADADADIRWIAAEMFRQFEEWIRENPEQWMWANKRWPERVAQGAASAKIFAGARKQREAASGEAV
jgi:KDO2-lipid IV(A) lauroyltransferase